MSMHKILLVEDDEGIAEGIVQLASQWNLEVKPVKDFRNIMGEFAEYNPQLVLLDISLPAYDGYYWCTQIRAQSDYLYKLHRQEHEYRYGHEHGRG